ncbi:putative G-protein coupled receptor B0563.6 [Tubulanus polymorphus]|uniref:putative G-protein coupled receptor B0563.6 n=1 Tax=Tubulanus polymorphus TaxID=672921 RepID=UPI003DA2E220
MLLNSTDRWKSADGDIGKPYHSSYALLTISQSSGNFRLLKQIVLPAIFCCGLFGNVASFLVMTSRKFRRYSYAVYLTALAISDLSICLSFTGIPILEYAVFSLTGRHGIAFSSVHLCKLYEFIFQLGGNCSSWLIVVTTIERLVAILFPFRFRRICTPRFARVVLATVIVPSAVLAAADILFIMRYTKPNGCFYRRRTQQAHFMFLVLYLYVAPLTIILVSNVLIVIFLNRRRVNDLADSVNNTKTIRSGKRVAVMLLTVSTVFAVTTIPSTITALVSLPASVKQPLFAAFQMLECCNFAVNFYIYILVGTDVRQYFVEKLTCRGKTEPG